MILTLIGFPLTCILCANSRGMKCDWVYDARDAFFFLFVGKFRASSFYLFPNLLFLLR